MVGNQVLLRQGAVLSDVQIAHIGRLGLHSVLVLPGLPGEAAGRLGAMPELEINMPDFRRLSSESSPGWMAGPAFSQSVPLPPELNDYEQLFAERKSELREAAGLSPLIDREKESQVNKGLQSSLILSAMTSRVDLERIDDLACTLATAIDRESDGQFIELVDISRFGESLCARSVLSAKVFAILRTGNGTLNFVEHMRGHLALCNVFALVPDELSLPLEDMDEATAARLKEAILDYSEWLSRRHFLADDTLELVLMRFERFDGSGFPHGLKGDEIHEVGHAWALAWSYCDRLVSKPERPRKTAQGAADELARQAGRAFAPSGINKFLRTVGLFPVGSLVQLSDGRLAMVVRQNDRALFRPIVRITDGEQMHDELDLTEYPGLFIQQQVLEY